MPDLHSVQMLGVGHPRKEGDVGQGEGSTAYGHNIYCVSLIHVVIYSRNFCTAHTNQTIIGLRCRFLLFQTQDMVEYSEWWCFIHTRVAGIKQAKERCCAGLHCLVPSFINNTQHRVGKIPFVIPFVLHWNSLISVSGLLLVCVCVSPFPIYLSRCLLIITSAPALFIQMGSITF